MKNLFPPDTSRIELFIFMYVPKTYFLMIFHVNLQKTNAFGKRRLFVSAIKLFMLFHAMSNSHKVIKSYADFND